MNSTAHIGSRPAPLGPAEAAALQGVDRICLARNSGHGSPALAHLVGPPGIVRVLDASTLAVSVCSDTRGVPGSRPDESGDHYTALMVDSEDQWALLVWGSVRWMPAQDASADLCATLCIAAAERPQVQLVILDVLHYDAVTASAQIG